MSSAHCKRFMGRLRLIVFLLIGPLAYADWYTSYKLDLERPIAVTHLPRTIPLPERIDLFVTTTPRDVDTKASHTSLMRTKPEHSWTNSVAIETIISLLQVNDNNLRVSNVNRRKGNTYHFLLWMPDKRVIHFRVFEPLDIQTKWCYVDPKSSAGSVYFNDKIGPWLRSAVLTNKTRSSFRDQYRKR